MAHIDFTTFENPTTRAYVAGLMDGEGSFSIGPSTSGSKGYRLQVQLGMSVKGILILEFLRDICGAKLSNPYGCRGPNRQPIIHAIWPNKTSQPFIEAIEPYLILKIKQARLALEFINFLGKGNMKWTHTNCKIGKHYRDTMRALNLRGLENMGDIVLPERETFPDLFAGFIESP